MGFVYAISFTGQNIFLSIFLSHTGQLFLRELYTRTSQAAGVRLYDCLQYLVLRVDSSWNVMARGDTGGSEGETGEWSG